MKIIAKVNSDTYIGEFSHEEVKKYFNKYYSREDFFVGKIIDLAKGYNFHEKIEKNFKLTKDFIDSNKEIIESILNGISVTGEDKYRDEEN